MRIRPVFRCATCAGTVYGPFVLHPQNERLPSEVPPMRHVCSDTKWGWCKLTGWGVAKHRQGPR